MIVVIGAGHNGLVAAVRLAESGSDVTVVEAAASPGVLIRMAVTAPPYMQP